MLIGKAEMVGYVVDFSNIYIYINNEYIYIYTYICILNIYLKLYIYVYIYTIHSVLFKANLVTCGIAARLKKRVAILSIEVTHIESRGKVWALQLGGNSSRHVIIIYICIYIYTYILYLK